MIVFFHFHLKAAIFFLNKSSLKFCKLNLHQGDHHTVGRLIFFLFKFSYWYTIDIIFQFKILISKIVCQNWLLLLDHHHHYLFDDLWNSFFQRKIDLKWLKKIIVNRISMLKMFDVLKNDPKMIIIIIILLFHDIK